MEWVLVAIIVVLVAVVGVLLARQQRSRRLQEGFGPEYKRTVQRSGDQREAESELLERRKRREELDIRPLEPEARERYRDAWGATQRRFVDDPQAAVGEADELVTGVMRDRGYPVDEFEEQAAVVSVDHPGVVENYRAGHAISRKCADGRAGTEDLRQAMKHYRALFAELLDDRGDGDEPRAETQDDVKEVR
jgi:hypothetical protein